jgi:SOS-response transcriptional repressor LexA
MLTERQQKVLDCIERLFAETGRSPSYREIAVETEIYSTGLVFNAVKALEERNFVRRVGRRGASRALEVIKPQTYLNPEYNRGLKEGLRLAKELAASEP